MADGTGTTETDNDTRECANETDGAAAHWCCHSDEDSEGSVLQPCHCEASIELNTTVKPYQPEKTLWHCTPTGESMANDSSCSSNCQCQPLMNTTLYSCSIGSNHSSNGRDSTGSTIKRKHPLRVVVFSPLPADRGYKPSIDFGYSIRPAVKLAVEHVNQALNILPPNVYVDPIFSNAGCDAASETAVAFVEIMTNVLSSGLEGPLGFIGPACSEDSIFVARFFREIWNLPVLYIGTTPYLSEHSSELPNAFGIISSTTVLIDALIRIATKENWNWKNIAVLYEELSTERHQDTYDTFIRGLLNDSQQVGYTRQITSSHIPLTEVIDRNFRIVVVISGKRPARQLACIAGQPTVKFAFPIQQFIFVERSLDDFLGEEFSFTELGENKDYHCDEETLIRGLNGSVFLNQALDSVDPDAVTVSNYTAGQVKQQYRERLLEYGKLLNMNLQETPFTYAYYDAIWALALGYDIQFSLLFSRSLLVDINDLILNNVSFQGVSNWIEFRSGGDQHVSNPVTITQVHGSNATVVGTLRMDNLTYSSKVFVPDKFKEINITLHPSLAIVGLSFALLSLIFTIILHVLNVRYRNFPSVKASSPRLNHFIFSGCYLFVVAIVIHTVLNVFPAFEKEGFVLCNADILCNVIGYGVIISTVLAKSWRTYRIFFHPFKTMRFLEDSSLALAIMFFSLVTILTFIPFLMLSPLKKNVSSTFDSSQWPPIKINTTRCGNDSKSIGYITIPLTFQLTLTIATMFLATLNKSIKRANFRTARRIFVFVYILAIVWALGGSLLTILHNSKQYSIEGTYSLYIVLLLTTIIVAQTNLLIPMFPKVFEKLNIQICRGLSTTSTGQVSPLKTLGSFLSKF